MMQQKGEKTSLRVDVYGRYCVWDQKAKFNKKIIVDGEKATPIRSWKTWAEC